MQRDQWDRLLALYATGGLSEEQKKSIYAAAMENQDFFNELIEEDALREAIEMPGARGRLIASLTSEPVRLWQPQAAAAPARRVRIPLWITWAAGIALMVGSGAITYRLLQPRAVHTITASSTPPRPASRDFSLPPAPAPARTAPRVTEEPPAIPAPKPAPAASIPTANISLPDAPPPLSDQLAKLRTAKAVGAADASGKDAIAAELREGNQPPPGPQPVPRPALMARKDIASRAAGSAAAVSQEISPGAVGSIVWRSTGDGIWTRVPAGVAVLRTDTIALRYVPRLSQTVTLLDEAGRSVLQKRGRAGEELEFTVPRALLEQAPGSALSLTLVESPELPDGEGAAKRKAPSAQPILRIILPLK